jgi:hypothetical protein
MKSISELNKKHPLHLLIYINYTYILISYQILTELSKLFDNARNINETRGKTEKNQKPKKKKDETESPLKLLLQNLFFTI